MAKFEWLVHLDLVQNELQNAVIQNLGTAPGSPLEGQLYYNSGDDNLYVYTGAGWVDLTSQGAGSTDLSTSYAATSVTINSSTGNNATINLANGTNAGVSENNLTDAMVTKLGNTTGTNSGDQTATLTAGTGITGSTYDPDTSTTFSLDFTELTDKTTSIAGTTEFILNDAGTESRKAASEIELSNFNNDAGWTSNTGTVTSVTGGNGLTGSVTTSGSLNVGAGTVITVNANDVAIDYLGTNNIIDSATNLEGTAINSGDTIIYHDATDDNVKKGFVSDLPFNNYSHPNHTGDVTSTGDGATTIANDVVTNAKLANMAGFTVKAKTSTGTGNPSDLSVSTNSVVGRLTGNITSISIIDDDTMGTASSSNLATAESIKAYVDNSNTGQSVYQGGYNASTNIPDLDTSPSGINQGFMYTVTADGTFFTEDVQVGDVLLAEQDNPTLLSHWTIVNKNIPDIVDASLTEKGLVELATVAETNTGTDATRAVTPDGLDGWTGSGQISTVGTITSGTWQGSAISTTYISNLSGTNTGDEVQATESTAGIAEIATQAETDAGSLDNRIVTPSKLATWKTNEALASKFAVDLHSTEGSVSRANAGGVTTFTVTHNLGSLDVTVNIREIATGTHAGAQITPTTTNAIEVAFNDGGNTNDDLYRVVIIG